jgi:hypothetical protein
MLLCDAAETVGGKLYVLGGGWTHLLTPGQPVNMALAVVVAVPWTETNKRHPLEVRLLTDDGETVSVNDVPVQAGGQIEVGRPIGIKPGSDLNAVLAFGFNGVVLEPGGYVWQLSISGVPEARTPFWVLAG